MTGEVVKVESGIPVEISQTANPIIAVIERASRDPNVDVAKMKELLQMQREIHAVEAEAAFNAAMRAAQAEMTPVIRDAENQHTRSRYALLETIDANIRPIYSRHGFALSFNSAPPSKPGLVRVICNVLHDQGHSRQYELEGDLDVSGAQGKANKTNIQGLGSSVSYLRRYLTCLIFNIVLKNEDNDGNSTKTITQRQIESIEDMVRQCGLDENGRASFLERVNAPSVDRIHPAVYPVAMNLLNAKWRAGNAR